MMLVMMLCSKENVFHIQHWSEEVGFVPLCFHSFHTVETAVWRSSRLHARLNQNWNPTHSSLIALMNLLKRPWSLCESVITLTIERNMQLLSFRNAKYSILFCVRILVVEKIFRLNIKSLSHLARRKNKA